MRTIIAQGFLFLAAYALLSGAVSAGIGATRQAGNDSLIIGIWQDYGGCLTRGNISDAQWRGERILRLSASKQSGFNTLFVPPREIEMELSFASGWKTTEMLVLVGPNPGEGTTTYTDYMKLLEAYFQRHGDAFRGVYIDEPSDVPSKWLDSSAGITRFEMLLKILSAHHLPLFFSGYSYFNLNDMLEAADYVYPSHSGKRLGTPLSHSGLFDGVRVYDTLLTKYGIRYYVLDDSWSLPTKTRFEIASDQRPVLQLFTKKLQCEMQSHPNLGGGGMFVNFGFDLGTFSKTAPRAGDPIHFEQLMSEFKELHRQQPAMKMFILYTGDLYLETINRMRAFYIRYRTSARSNKSNAAPVENGCTAKEETVWDETVAHTPCNVFENLILLSVGDYDTSRSLSGAITVTPKVDGGSIFRLCNDTSEAFKAGFLDCLQRYLSHFPPGNEEYAESPHGTSANERNQAFQHYIQPEYSEAYIQSLQPYFMECDFFRDLVCRLYTLRFDAFVYSAKKLGLL